MSVSSHRLFEGMICILIVPIGKNLYEKIITCKRQIGKNIAFFRLSKRFGCGDQITPILIDAKMGIC